MLYFKILKIVKDIIFEFFIKNDGYVRVLFVIVVFGMGVNVKGVKIIIYVGLFKNLEVYV